MSKLRFPIQKIVLILVAVLFSRTNLQAGCDGNCITNIVWKVRLEGALAIQDFDSDLSPSMMKRRFNTRDFLRIVLGREPSSSEVLTLSFQQSSSGGAARFSLGVYNTVNLSFTSQVSSGEVTTTTSDGKEFVFSVNAPLPSGISSSFWRGGNVELAGRATELSGVPTEAKGKIQGFLVDSRPSSSGGTTGILMNASFRTYQAPLLVQPSIINP